MAGLKDFDPLPENKRNLESLIQKITGGECCAFIGAGLSVDAKYPTWGKLIEKLKENVEQKLGHEFVLESSALPDQIEELRKELTEEEYKLNIIAMCGAGGKLHYLPLHQTLIKIPFCSYVTTNYDYCIENSITNNPNKILSHTYPELDETLLRNGHIFHIHGVLAVDNPEEKFNTLVLSRRDYDNAYSLETGTGLPRFLSILYERLSIVFLGYSLNDHELINTIRVAKSSLNLRVDYERLSGLGERILPQHFIVLRKDDQNINEDAIKSLGLLPIYFNGADYSTLQGALEGIREVTTSVHYEEVPLNWEMFEDS